MAASIHTVTRQVSKHEWASQTGRGVSVELAHSWGCRGVAECVRLRVAMPRRQWRLPQDMRTPFSPTARV
jgi:hypothetical protein